MVTVCEVGCVIILGAATVVEITAAVDMALPAELLMAHV